MARNSTFICVEEGEICNDEGCQAEKTLAGTPGPQAHVSDITALCPLGYVDVMLQALLVQFDVPVNADNLSASLQRCGGAPGGCCGQRL